MCGENRPGQPRWAGPPGSSPRVRGKPALAAARDMKLGLIPACAGKTLVCQVFVECSWAHPRVCGENDLRGLSDLARVGSSPRVRGKPDGFARSIPDEGLIPACAGKTTRPNPPTGQHGAHPRVCGENPGRCNPKRGLPGSSPRVRGKQPCERQEFSRWGLIPACAGKT